MLFASAAIKGKKKAGEKWKQGKKNASGAARGPGGESSLTDTLFKLDSFIHNCRDDDKRSVHPQLRRERTWEVGTERTGGRKDEPSGRRNSGTGTNSFQKKETNEHAKGRTRKPNRHDQPDRGLGRGDGGTKRLSSW